MDDEKNVGRPDWESLYELERAGALAAESESKKYSAEAEYFDSMARQMDLDSAQKKLQLEVLTIKKEQVEEQRRDEKAQDKFHKLFVFAKSVDEDSVTECIKALRLWDRQDLECPIEILFNSPGGDMIQGLMLFDYICSLTRTHEVTTVTYGMAASMAGILMQAGSHRSHGSRGLAYDA